MIMTIIIAATLAGTPTVLDPEPLVRQLRIFKDAPPKQKIVRSWPEGFRCMGGYLIQEIRTPEGNRYENAMENGTPIRCELRTP